MIPPQAAFEKLVGAKLFEQWSKSTLSCYPSSSFFKACYHLKKDSQIIRNFYLRFSYIDSAEAVCSIEACVYKSRFKSEMCSLRSLRKLVNLSVGNNKAGI
jgi:hypothetical protein